MVETPIEQLNTGDYILLYHNNIITMLYVGIFLGDPSCPCSGKIDSKLQYSVSIRRDGTFGVYTENVSRTLTIGTPRLLFKLSDDEFLMQVLDYF